jgi:hypothetical protein
MHEREPDEDDEMFRPVFMASISEFDDVGLRGSWMEAAESIAETEEHIGLHIRRAALRGKPVLDGKDHLEPAFLYVGDSESLAFIAEMAAGIIKHGQAFAFWVREMGNRPDSLDEFAKVFLGQWKSAEDFTQHVLEDHGRTEDPERDDDEESRPDLPTDAKSWAHDLQRRGEISVIPNPRGGVWVFRGW